MSYDIDLPCPTCGHTPSLPNPTYNLTPIFDRALTGEELPNPEVGEAGVVLFGERTDTHADSSNPKGNECESIYDT